MSLDFLKEDESLTEINNDLSLIEKKGSQLFSTDAYMLYAYMKKNPFAIAAELGGGSGVVSFLSVTKEKFKKVYSIEIQPELADICNRNIIYNHLEDKVSVINKDLRSIDQNDLPEVDVVFSNPPYMKANSGKTSDHDIRKMARHELNGDIKDFCACAFRILKFGGFFYTVYRPERLCDLFCAMRDSNLEPKECLFISSSEDKEPSTVLVKGKKGALPGLFVAPILYIYSDNEHKTESEDYKYIYENGDFNDRFRK